MPEKNTPKKVSLKVDASTGKFVVSDILSTRKSTRPAVLRKKTTAPSTDLPATAFERPHPTTTPSDRQPFVRKDDSSLPAGMPHDPTPLEEWLEKNKQYRMERQSQMPPDTHQSHMEELPAPEEHKMLPRRPAKTHPKRRLLLVLAALIAFGAVGYMASEKLAKLYVTVYPRIERKSIATDIIFSTATNGLALPAELITFTHTQEQEFPASNLSDIRKKASGTIIVFNTISSVPQRLVANTRFAAKNGKIYRIQSPLTIPAATLKDGKLVTAGAVEVVVTAQEAGTDYNMDLTDFTIPGFQGTEKYKGFYAKSKTPMGGGFIGKSYAPTSGELAKAEEALMPDAKTKAASELSQKIPAGFVLLEGATEFASSFRTVDREAMPDRQTFLARQTTEVRAIIYKQSDLVARLAEANGMAKGLVDIKNPNDIKLTVSHRDTKAGTMTLRASGDATFLWRVNNQELARALADAKSTANFDAVFKKYPAITKAEYKFSLPWVRTIPANLDYIFIETKEN